MLKFDRIVVSISKQIMHQKYFFQLWNALFQWRAEKVIMTCATHANLLHDVMATKSQTQNSSAHGHVFRTIVLNGHFNKCDKKSKLQNKQVLWVYTLYFISLPFIGPVTGVHVCHQQGLWCCIRLPSRGPVMLLPLESPLIWLPSLRFPSSHQAAEAVQAGRADTQRPGWLHRHDKCVCGSHRSPLWHLMGRVWLPQLFHESRMQTLAWNSREENKRQEINSPHNPLCSRCSTPHAVYMDLL